MANLETIPEREFDFYDGESENHQHIVNMRQAIHDFSWPQAATLLNELNGLTKTDLSHIGYLSQCMCGCVENVTVWFSLTARCDADSLRYILDHKLFSPSTLTDILVEMLPVTGIYMTKKRRGLPDEEVSNYITNCVDILLPHLCAHCPEQLLLRKDLLFTVHAGHAPVEKLSQWSHLLLQIGCDPLHQIENETPLGAFINRLDLRNVLYVRERLGEQEFRRGINLPRGEYSANNLMILLRSFRLEKNRQFLDELTAMIEFIVPYMNLHWQDSSGCNVSDYIIQYGYKLLFAELLEKCGIAAVPPTEHPVPIPEWIEKSERKRSCHSDFTIFLYQWRYAKSPAELALFERAKTQLYGQRQYDRDERYAIYDFRFSTLFEPE